MDPVFGIFLFIIFILSAVFHEYAHGWMAYRLGDPTAKNMGRLTLNPLAHIDLFGSILLPALLVISGSPFVFGWAKPVPYNPYNLRDPKYGSLKVALAGPATNMLVAIVLSILLRINDAVNILGSFPPQFITFVSMIVFINVVLAIFNLIPFPPLDGSKIFSDLFPHAWQGIMRMGFLGIFVSLIIAYTILGPVASFVFQILVGRSIGAFF